MDTIRDYISWGVIIGGSITFIGFLIRYLIQKKIDSYFNTKLETHKKDIAIITEQAKYDINKKLFDFEAYASKKHDVYPNLYSLAFELWDELSRFGYKFGIKIELIRAEDGLDNDVLKSFFFQTETESIEYKINKAYTYFYKNELYLSKDTAAAYTETLESLRKFTYDIDYSFYTYSNSDDWENILFSNTLSIWRFLKYAKRKSIY